MPDTVLTPEAVIIRPLRVDLYKQLLGGYHTAARHAGGPCQVDALAPFRGSTTRARRPHRDNHTAYWVLSPEADRLWVIFPLLL